MRFMQLAVLSAWIVSGVWGAPPPDEEKVINAKLTEINAQIAANQLDAAIGKLNGELKKAQQVDNKAKILFALYSAYGKKKDTAKQAATLGELEKLHTSTLMRAKLLQLKMNAAASIPEKIKFAKQLQYIPADPGIRCQAISFLAQQEKNKRKYGNAARLYLDAARNYGTTSAAHWNYKLQAMEAYNAQKSYRQAVQTVGLNDESHLDPAQKQTFQILFGNAVRHLRQQKNALDAYARAEKGPNIAKIAEARREKCNLLLEAKRTGELPGAINALLKDPSEKQPYPPYVRQQNANFAADVWIKIKNYGAARKILNDAINAAVTPPPKPDAKPDQKVPEFKIDYNNLFNLKMKLANLEFQDKKYPACTKLCDEIAAGKNFKPYQVNSAKQLKKRVENELKKNQKKSVQQKKKKAENEIRENLQKQNYSGALKSASFFASALPAGSVERLEILHWKMRILEKHFHNRHAAEAVFSPETLRQFSPELQARCHFLAGELRRSRRPVNTESVLAAFRRGYETAPGSYWGAECKYAEIASSTVPSLRDRAVRSARHFLKSGTAAKFPDTAIKTYAKLVELLCALQQPDAARNELEAMKRKFPEEKYAGRLALTESFIDVVQGCEAEAIARMERLFAARPLPPALRALRQEWGWKLHSRIPAEALAIFLDVIREEQDSPANCSSLAISGARTAGKIGNAAAADELIDTALALANLPEQSKFDLQKQKFYNEKFHHSTAAGKKYLELLKRDRRFLAANGNWIKGEEFRLEHRPDPWGPSSWGRHNIRR